VTSSVVGRQPSGSCASWRVTVSRAVPSHPHRRHQPSSATTRQASTARSGSSRWPTTSRPRSSRRANVVRSGAVKVASGTSRSSRWAASELPSSEDLDPYPTSDAPMPTLASTRPRLHPGSGRAPFRLHLNVLLAVEQRLDPLGLLVGEQRGAGVQRATGTVERVALAAAVPAGLLLNPATALIERVAGQAHDVKRVHDGDRVGQFLDGGGLEAGEAVHGHHFQA